MKRRPCCPSPSWSTGSRKFVSLLPYLAIVQQTTSHLLVVNDKLLTRFNITNGSVRHASIVDIQLPHNITAHPTIVVHTTVPCNNQTNMLLLGNSCHA
eukprot:COSAG02_NODE_1870_length_10588_cov_78.982652_9_plen_98_part_00